MIALDANTALRSFYDAQYDIKAILQGLPALLEEGLDVHFFKFADGKAVPVPPASLIHDITAAFESVVVGGAITVALREGQLAISIARSGYAGLEAHFEGPSLQYKSVGPVPITATRIRKLVVRSVLRAADISLDGQALSSLQGYSARFESWAADAVQAGAVAVAEPSTTEALQVSSQRLGEADYVSPSLVYMLLGKDLAKYYFGVAPDYSPAPAPVIDLKGPGITLARAPLSGVSGYLQLKYTVPVASGSSVVQYEVASSSTNILGGSGTPNVPNLPKGLADMLIWPYWALSGSWTQNALTGASDVRTYTNTWSIEVPPVSLNGPFPYIAVRVRNSTGAAIPRVANAWNFSAVGGVAKVAVLSRVTLPPYSEVEFLFSYSAAANCGFMFPSRVLNG